MNGSIKIGRVFGIPIYLHITFLVILPLFVWVFSESTGRMLGMALGFGDLHTDILTRYVFGTIAAILFFATILAHELAHSYLAKRYGVRIKSITLMLFGGVASMEEIPKQPGQELKMAFAGPFTSLVIGVFSYAVMLILESFAPGTVLWDGVAIIFGLMALYNVLLAGFNMIPAFPMDGGRVLRSYYGSRMSHLEATKRAAKIGRYMAIAMGVFGVVTFNVWLILIAFFVYVGASEEEQSTVTSESLGGKLVGQLMTRDVQVVHPGTSVQQLLDLMFATKHMGFPVVDNGLVGIVTLSDTHRVQREQLPFVTVGQIMTRQVVWVPPELEATKALRIMAERGIDRLVVLDQGRLVGIITKKDFMRVVELMSARSSQTAGWGYVQQQQPPSPPPPTI
jgi:Zn-dependent protease